MENIYNKWFGTNAEIMSILTYITFAILGVVAVCSLLAAAKLRYYDYKHALDEEGEKALSFKKKAKKCLWIGVACAAFPIIWPILLTILDAAGVGKIVDGDFVPSTFTKTFSNFLDKGNIWAL